MTVLRTWAAKASPVTLAAFASVFAMAAFSLVLMPEMILDRAEFVASPICLMELA